MANWTFQHIPTTWPPSREFLLADLGCSWKPLEAIAGWWHEPPPWNPRMSYSGSSHQIGVVGHMLKNQNTPQKKGKPMATLSGSFKWTIEMDVENPSAPQVMISSSKNMPLIFSILLQWFVLMWRLRNCS